MRLSRIRNVSSAAIAASVIVATGGIAWSQGVNQAIPADVLAIVQWVDLEKFAASPLVFVPPVNVTLNHLNPMFTAQPAVAVTLRQASALLLPVSKNGAVPPPP